MSPIIRKTVKFVSKFTFHPDCFAPEMCLLLFQEPSKCSPPAGVSRFSQPSRHLLRSCASNLCKPLSNMSHSSTSFHLFFGLPFFVLSTSKCSAFSGSLSSSLLSTCLNNRNFALSALFPISLHPSSNASLYCLFYTSWFSTYHLQHSHLSSFILFVNQKQLRYSRVSNSQK